METQHNFHQEDMPTPAQIEESISNLIPAPGKDYTYDEPMRVETDGELACWQVVAIWSEG